MELKLEESAAVGDENNDESEGEEDDNSELTQTLFGKGSCTKKKQANFGTFPKGGGGQGPIQSKRGTFCHRQIPTRIFFILPHIHGGASLCIPHKYYP